MEWKPEYLESCANFAELKRQGRVEVKAKMKGNEIIRIINDRETLWFVVGVAMWYGLHQLKRYQIAWEVERF